MARKSETIAIFHGFLPDFLSQGSMMIELQWDDSWSLINDTPSLILQTPCCYKYAALAQHPRRTVRRLSLLHSGKKVKKGALFFEYCIFISYLLPFFLQVCNICFEVRARTTDTQWMHKSKKSENLADVVDKICFGRT